MIYKLFTEFITLQALLKELGIIQSGGAIKRFLAEKTRVAALVKQMNQANKKTSSKHKNRQSTTKKSLRATKKTKGKPTAPVRFPGI
ncbi:TPA: RNA-binding S4 domain-containing protein [Streptococcus pyogenes]|nr:RNA-binding S4 domain-containing protein [Streptococcus pyogenes]